MTKKETAALALLIAAAAGGIFMGVQALTWNEVPVKMTDLEGDRSELEGTAVTCRTTLGDRGVWTTEFTPADGEADTVFRSRETMDKDVEITGDYYILDFLGSSDSGMTWDDFEDKLNSGSADSCMGYPTELFREFEEKAADQDKYTEVISLKGWCTAVNPDVSLQWQYPDDEETAGDGQYKEYGREVLFWGEDTPVAQALAEIFADPVTDDMKVTITKAWDTEWGDGETTISVKRDPAGQSTWLTTGLGTEALILKQTVDGSGQAWKNSETDSRLYVLDMAQIREDWLGRDQDESMGDGSMDVVRTQVQSALKELAEMPDGFTAQNITLAEDGKQALILGYSGEDNSIRTILTVDVENGGILQEVNTDTETGTLLDRVIAFREQEDDSDETAELTTDEWSGMNALSDVEIPELQSVETQNGAVILAYSDGNITVLKPEGENWKVWLQTSAEDSFALPDDLDSESAVRASDGIPLIASSMDNCRYLFDGEKLVVAGIAYNGDYYRGEYQYEDESGADYDCSVAHGVVELCVYTPEGLQYRGLAELQGRGILYNCGWAYDLDRALELSWEAAD